MIKKIEKIGLIYNCISIFLTNLPNPPIGRFSGLVLFSN